jgi:hypothetical protein
MHKKILSAIFSLGLSTLLVGCGTYVPQVGEIWDGPYGTRDIEFEIRKRVYCDLKKAVISAKQIHVEKKTSDGKVISFAEALPDDWGAQVTVGLNIDESTTLSPGATLNTPMHNGITHFIGETPIGATPLVAAATYPSLPTNQFYQLGFGGSLSSKATRNDKINAYWAVSYLKQQPTTNSYCAADAIDPLGDNAAKSSPLILVSDLGIEKWLIESLEMNNLLPSVQDGASSDNSPDVLQFEAKFEIASTGNINPTWKLVRISANTSNTPLLGTNRTRAHDLTITIGPGSKPGTSNAPANKKQLAKASSPKAVETSNTPGDRAANLHQATQIGIAVSNNLRSVLQP